MHRPLTMRIADRVVTGRITYGDTANRRTAVASLESVLTQSYCLKQQHHHRCRYRRSSGHHPRRACVFRLAHRSGATAEVRRSRDCGHTWACFVCVWPHRGTLRHATSTDVSAHVFLHVGSCPRVCRRMLVMPSR